MLPPRSPPAASALALVLTSDHEPHPAGTVMVVAIAVVGSLTVLPALLSKLGDRVEKGRVPFLRQLRREDGEGRIWGAVLDRVLRRPLVSALAAAGLPVALAVPAFGLHTSLPGLQGLPRSLAVMKTYDRVQAAFPGGPLPAVVVVKAGDVTSPQVAGSIRDLGNRALASGQMRNPIQVDVNADRTVARVSIPLAGKGTDVVSNRALATLRGTLLPATVGAVPGVTAAVTGITAGSRDFNDQMRSKAPIVFAFVLVLDYHVFILSRVRETFDRGLGTEEAVAHGIKTTAGVVTSAALVMVAVFAVFATLSQLELKQLGVGLAAAILIDATIVRAVLLPATMKLLGEWNWWFPRWLEWLPRIAAGEQPAPAPAPAPQAAPAFESAR